MVDDPAGETGVWPDTRGTTTLGTALPSNLAQVWTCRQEGDRGEDDALVDEPPSVEPADLVLSDAGTRDQELGDERPLHAAGS